MQLVKNFWSQKSYAHLSEYEENSIFGGEWKEAKSSKKQKIYVYQNPANRYGKFYQVRDKKRAIYSIFFCSKDCTYISRMHFHC